MWGYGDIYDLGDIYDDNFELVDEAYPLPEEYMIRGDGELPLNNFLAIHSSGLVNIPMTAEKEFFPIIEKVAIGGYDAFFSTLYAGGRLAGRRVYENGLGNEYRYGMPFGEFLDEQGWSLDDFMEIYSEHINNFASGLTKAAVTESKIKTSDFCEFYDVYHRSPFDGIRVYIPAIIKMATLTQYGEYLEEGKPKVTVVKKKAIFNQDGSFEIEDVGEIILDDNSIDLPFDKDEFVSEITVTGALKIFVAEYMRINVKLSLKDTFNSVNNLKLRLYANDFTYMEERYFDYE
jgi:hypothetical protein